MTGEEFVRACFEEKQSILNEYFSDEYRTTIAGHIKGLIVNGADKELLYSIINESMSEILYIMLRAIDGETSLNGIQNKYKLYDEDGNILNECGELGKAAFKYLIENK